MKITVTKLRKLRACKKEVERFKALFPRGVQVTEALCVQHADDFDWVWAARHLLSSSARAEYERVADAAWAEYDRAKTAALAEYNRVRAAAWAEYERARDAAWAEYKRATAAAFGRLAEAE